MSTHEGQCPTCEQPTPFGFRIEWSEPVPPRELKALRERDEAIAALSAIRLLPISDGDSLCASAVFRYIDARLAAIRRESL